VVLGKDSFTTAHLRRGVECLDKCLTIILIHGFIATNKAFNGPEEGSEVKSKHLFHLFHKEDVVYIVWFN